MTGETRSVNTNLGCREQCLPENCQHYRCELASTASLCCSTSVALQSSNVLYRYQKIGCLCPHASICKYLEWVRPVAPATLKDRVEKYQVIWHGRRCLSL